MCKLLSDMYAFIPYSLVLSVICLSVSVLSHASQETAKYKQISPVSANHADYNNLAGNSNKNNAAAIKYIDRALCRKKYPGVFHLVLL